MCENKTPTTATPFPQSSLTRVAPRHPDSDPVPFGGGRPAADETLTTALRSPDVGSGAAEAGEAHAWRGRAAERARGGRERRQRSCGGRRVHAEAHAAGGAAETRAGGDMRAAARVHRPAWPVPDRGGARPGVAARARGALTGGCKWRSAPRRGCGARALRGGQRRTEAAQWTGPHVRTANGENFCNGT